MNNKMIQDKYNGERESFARARFEQLQKVFLSSLLGNQWLFRGVSNADYQIKTSMDRFMLDHVVRSNKQPDGTFACAEEDRLIQTFKLLSYEHLKDRPTDRDYVSWLSLMQHYGAPTRLLDFTCSPYIALFFAVSKYFRSYCINRTSEDLKPIAIYAIKKTELTKLCDVSGTFESERQIQVIAKANEYLGNLFSGTGSKQEEGAFFIEPLANHSRLRYQQGAFIMSKNSQKTMEENLKTAMECQISQQEITYTGDSTSEQPTAIRKLVIGMSAEFLKLCCNYFRAHNITFSNLFPGLDGIGKELTLDMRSQMLNEL